MVSQSFGHCAKTDALGLFWSFEIDWAVETDVEVQDFPKDPQVFFFFLKDFAGGRKTQKPMRCVSSFAWFPLPKPLSFTVVFLVLPPFAARLVVSSSAALFIRNDAWMRKGACLEGE